MSTDAWIEEHWIGEAVLPRPRRAPKLPALPVPHAPTCCRGNAALAAHAQSRDSARHPGDRLSARQDGRNVVDQQARKLTQPPEICDAFIEAAVAEGFPRNPDYNNGNQDGFGYYQATQKNGRRWSTARAFLDPARHRPNLRIETEALATRILFDGKRAVGVAYLQRGEAREARCGREAILAAGAVKSPHLLELSGVGNPELLKAVDIPVRHDLRGVGENYRDHYSSRLNWRVKLPVTLNEQTRGLALAKEVIKYYAQRRGVLTFTAALAHGFVRTGPGLAVP